MLDFDAYKTYLAYAIGAASPKMKRKVKIPASPSKKRTLVTIEEEESEPAKKVVPTKKPATKRQSSGVQIRDTPAQLKKALKRSKRETTIHQARGSSVGADFKSEVPDEPKGKLIDTSKGTGLKSRVLDDEEVQESDDEPQHADDERTDSENQEINDDEEETQDDKFVHTPKDNVPTDDETNNELNDVTEEEYERINEELYGDVNVSLTDDEPANKEKDNVEIMETRRGGLNSLHVCFTF
ncbi:hypothetical protein Tco_0672041 [Tanacetum coccineum]